MDRAQVDVGRWGTEPSRCGKHGKAAGALGFMGHGRGPGHWLNNVNKGRGMGGKKEWQNEAKMYGQSSTAQGESKTQGKAS